MKNLTIIGHRGFRARFPENTAISFLKAFEHGADGIECDIQKTKDSEYVIIHDDTIDRTCSGSGEISNLTLAELKKFNFNMRISSQTEKIITLKELLKLIPPDKFVNLELKEETLTPEDSEKIYTIAKNNFDTGNILFSSFEPDLLYFFRDNKITFGFLIGDKIFKRGIIKIIRSIGKLHPDFINLPVNPIKFPGPFFYGILIKQIRKFTKKILFWTVNSKKELQFTLKYSRYIITDDPPAIRSYLSEICKKK
jgi:glycerophosphoryl diester phosphodiesterase